MSTPQTNENQQFAQRLINWQKQYGRHSLPWQGPANAYRSWLSEVMLQQTQVTTVIPYFTRFIERFPTVADLAAAPTDDVMALWSGLGYYSRARNLHACAQAIMRDWQGEFPRQASQLATLPGIGRSTAAAIAAFAFGERAAILDGNVKRVLTRVFAIAGVTSEKKVENKLWELAESLLPDHDIQSYTQGLMDLGATICTRSRPQCQRCPMQSECLAYARSEVNLYPTPKPRKEQKTKHAIMILLRTGRHIWLENRPNQGIWGGLYSLPEWKGMHEEPIAVNPDLYFELQLNFASWGEIYSCREVEGFNHVFSHFKLQCRVIEVEIKHPRPHVAETRATWMPYADALKLGLPTPIRSLLQQRFEKNRD